MTVRQMVENLEHVFSLHQKDEQLTHQEQNQRLSELEEFQKMLKSWVDWALKIVLGAMLVGLLVLLGLKV
jgi:hypothetical protein